VDCSLNRKLVGKTHRGRENSCLNTQGRLMGSGWREHWIDLYSKGKKHIVIPVSKSMIQKNREKGEIMWDIRISKETLHFTSERRLMSLPGISAGSHFLEYKIKLPCEGRLCFSLLQDSSKNSFLLFNCHVLQVAAKIVLGEFTILICIFMKI
jgi:hypothetical protein